MPNPRIPFDPTYTWVNGEPRNGAVNPRFMSTVESSVRFSAIAAAGSIQAKVVAAQTWRGGGAGVVARAGSVQAVVLPVP